MNLAENMADVPCLFHFVIAQITYSCPEIIRKRKYFQYTKNTVSKRPWVFLSELCWPVAGQHSYLNAVV